MGSLDGQQPSLRATGSKLPAPRLSPGLHVVATPIGNLGDMTDRARKALAGADAVCCEDTRVTGSLFKHLGLSAPKLIPYHEHNAEAMRPRVLARLAAGEAVVLVSDAGTPLISDPGFKLVRAAQDAGQTVVPVPGASALLTALVISGLPSDRFLFGGFLPTRDKARRDVLEELAAVPATLVFYESTRRLPDSLASMADILGPREAAVCRELTKMHEEVRRALLPDLVAHYAAEGPPKGECVVVIGPPLAGAEASEADIDALLRDALASGQSVRDAAATVAAALGRKKREVYAHALELAKESNG